MYLSDVAATLLVYSLASASVVDLWLRGSIFATARARVEAEADRWPRLAELLGCEHCLSHQTPFWLLLIFELPARFLLGHWAMVIRLPVFALAIGRLAWLMASHRENNVIQRDEGTNDHAS